MSETQEIQRPKYGSCQSCDTYPASWREKHGTHLCGSCNSEWSQRDEIDELTSLVAEKDAEIARLQARLAARFIDHGEQ